MNTNMCRVVSYYFRSNKTHFFIMSDLEKSECICNLLKKGRLYSCVECSMVFITPKDESKRIECCKCYKILCFDCAKSCGGRRCKNDCEYVICSGCDDPVECYKCHVWK